MSRTFMVYINIDLLNASMVGCFTDADKAQWAMGFQAGCMGVQPIQGWPQPMVAGHSVGFTGRQASENYIAKKRQAGEKSAEVRASIHGSSQPKKPEHCSNDARTMLEQCSNNVRTPPELSNIQYPISTIDKPITNSDIFVAEEPAPKKSSRFTPPAMDEVEAYCQERGNSIDPQAFIDYYEARGWMLGKSKMKDWKASVRTWEKNSNNRPSAKTSDPTDIGEDEYIGRGQRYIDRLHATAPTEEEFRAIFPTWAAEIDRENAAKKAKAEQEAQQDA